MNDTDYIELASPWTNIRVKNDVIHVRISLWARGGLAGTLTVDTEDLDAVLLGFFRGRQVCRRRRGSLGVKLLVDHRPRSRVVYDVVNHTVVPFHRLLEKHGMEDATRPPPKGD